MKKRLPIVIILSIILALGIPGIILIVRSPVLVVSDLSFFSLYGTERARIELLRSSLALFRLVKVVPIANDAGDDILLFAINAASSRPYCVLFPMRFSGAAKMFREKFPEMPIILLEGRNVLDSRNQAAWEGFFRFKTDVDTDFYRAGLYAAIIDGERNKRINIYINRSIRNSASESFRQSFRDQDKILNASFASAYAQEAYVSEISCAVLAGAGAEFLEKNQDIPVIFFTWLNPDATPRNTVIIFDDSPLVQAVPAVKMAAAGITDGQIASKILILSARVADNGILKNLKKAKAAGLEWRTFP
jgi:hypothetical protein